MNSQVCSQLENANLVGSSLQDPSKVGHLSPLIQPTLNPKNQFTNKGSTTSSVWQLAQHIHPGLRTQWPPSRRTRLRSLLSFVHLAFCVLSVDWSGENCPFR